VTLHHSHACKPSAIQIEKPLILQGKARNDSLNFQAYTLGPEAITLKIGDATGATLPLYLIELSVKSCPVGSELHPSFDASSPPGCSRQSHEILLNKGMKY